MTVTINITTTSLKGFWVDKPGDIVAQSVSLVVDEKSICLWRMRTIWADEVYVEQGTQDVARIQQDKPFNITLFSSVLGFQNCRENIFPVETAWAFEEIIIGKLFLEFLVRTEKDFSRICSFDFSIISTSFEVAWLEDRNEESICKEKLSLVEPFHGLLAQNCLSRSFYHRLKRFPEVVTVVNILVKLPKKRRIRRIQKLFLFAEIGVFPLSSRRPHGWEVIINVGDVCRSCLLVFGKPFLGCFNRSIVILEGCRVDNELNNVKKLLAKFDIPKEEKTWSLGWEDNFGKRQKLRDVMTV